MIRAIMLFLHSYGVGTSRAVRIFKTYGADALQLISENAYRLARDNRGNAIKTADQIAQRFGIEPTALIRARAGIRGPSPAPTPSRARWWWSTSGGREVAYGFGELDAVVPAYATTVPKAPGAGDPAVVIPRVTQHYAMLRRNLVDTAVTRGKKLVVIVRPPQALALAVKGSRARRRW